MLIMLPFFLISVLKTMFICYRFHFFVEIYWIFLEKLICRQYLTDVSILIEITMFLTSFKLDLKIKLTLKVIIDIWCSCFNCSFLLNTSISSFCFDYLFSQIILPVYTQQNIFKIKTFVK